MGGAKARAFVHVLMRGVTLFGDAPAERILGSFCVMLTGDATPARWTPRRIRAGDVEGVVWTTRAELPHVINQLLRTPGVLDAKGGEGEATVPPPKR